MIIKTTIRKDKSGLKLYQVEKLSMFSPTADHPGYTPKIPYFGGGANKYKKWEYNGNELLRYVRWNEFIEEEVIILKPLAK